MDLPTEDLAGTWDVTGRTRTLTAPSEAWETERDAQEDPAPTLEQQAAAALVQLVADHGPDRVGIGLAIGLGIADRSSELTTALADIPAGPVADAITVVADAATTATQETP